MAAFLARLGSTALYGSRSLAGALGFRGRWRENVDAISTVRETGNSVHNNRSEPPQDQMTGICFWRPTRITENRLHQPLALTTTIRLRDAGQQETYLNAVRREQDLADWSTREMWRDHFW
ncbi:MAG TPA: hypothetical protein VEW05_27755 [Candidatus Polarisedimenticolia bacterium]|nr:hypothetical protein [Candidatus Polarisedimenticolia bacterium]